jgi:hypothetical protein
MVMVLAAIVVEQLGRHRYQAPGPSRVTFGSTGSWRREMAGVWRRLCRGLAQRIRSIGAQAVYKISAEPQPPRGVDLPWNRMTPTCICDSIVP